MRKFLSNLFFVCLLACSGFNAEAQHKPKLDSRWQMIPDTHNDGRNYLILRLQIRCESGGQHRINSADFYIDYDSAYLTFNKSPVRGEDFRWAPGFDPALNPFYKYSKVAALGMNPFNNSGDNLMDISIVDTITTAGVLLDSGKWVDVVDLKWEVVQPGANTQIVWAMVMAKDTLTGVYDAFEEKPKNYDAGEGWDLPFFVK